MQQFNQSHIKEIVDEIRFLIDKVNLLHARLDALETVFAKYSPEFVDEMEKIFLANYAEFVKQRK